MLRQVEVEAQSTRLEISWTLSFRVSKHTLHFPCDFEYCDTMNTVTTGQTVQTDISKFSFCDYIKANFIDLSDLV